MLTPFQVITIIDLIIADRDVLQEVAGGFARPDELLQAEVSMMMMMMMMMMMVMMMMMMVVVVMKTMALW